MSTKRRKSEGPVYHSSLGFDIKPVTGRFTGTRDKTIAQLRESHIHEGGHDPELTGSEDQPMSRREHFDQGAAVVDRIQQRMKVYDADWWGDDPFKGIPGAHGEHDKPM